jgi:hypothetical protein
MRMTCTSCSALIDIAIKVHRGLAHLYAYYGMEHSGGTPCGKRLVSAQ